MTLKPCVGVNGAIPVELRQPRANSLAVGGDDSSLGEGLSCRVDAASKEAMPKLGGAAKPVGSSTHQKLCSQTLGNQGQ